MRCWAATGTCCETAGLTYAQYAREGFAQLVVVTALTLVVVAVAARRAPRETARDRLMSRVALGVLCLGTLGVVASALRRMDLYVDAFGLTRLRVFVTVVEIALAAVFVLVLVAGIRWRGPWLPRAAVQVLAVAMLGLALVNPDAQIVRHNTTAELAVPARRRLPRRAVGRRGAGVRPDRRRPRAAVPACSTSAGPAAAARVRRLEPGA